MNFLLAVDNTQMEGTVSQIFNIGPSFDFMIKKRETVGNCFFGIYSLYHKTRNNSSIKILRHILRIASENVKYFGRIVTEILTFEKIV